jgi:hypothetical protein
MREREQNTEKRERLRISRRMARYASKAGGPTQLKPLAFLMTPACATLAMFFSMVS